MVGEGLEGREGWEEEVALLRGLWGGCRRTGVVRYDVSLVGGFLLHLLLVCIFTWVLASLWMV